MRFNKMMRVFFWVAVGLGLLLHFWTLPYSSNHWQDEVQICEMGRRVYEKTDWNLYKMPETRLDTVAPGIWLVGPIAQETAYRIFGHLGPKIAALVYLFVATILLRFYLRCKTGSDVISSVVSGLFFSAPAIVQSVRGARVDILSFANLFAAVALLQVKTTSSSFRRFLLVGFGAMCALCVLTWPTSVLLMPIALWEFIEYLRCNCKNVRDAASSFFAAGVGGILISIITLSPSLCNLSTSIDVYRLLSRSSMDPNCKIRWAAMCHEMMTSFGFYIVGMLCLFVCWRSWMVLLGGVLFFVICAASSRIYVFKTVYFVPYAICGIAMTWNLIFNKYKLRWLAVVPCLMCVLFYVRSVLGRNVIEYLVRHYRNVENQTSILAQHIGKGKKVYNLAWQTYFPGRMLGWRQYQYYFGAPSCEEWASYDFVMLEGTGLKNEDLINNLHHNGFVNVMKIDIPPTRTSRLDAALMKRGFVKPLGPYYLFSK